MFQRLNNNLKGENKALLHEKLSYRFPYGQEFQTDYTVDPVIPYQRSFIKAWNYWWEKKGKHCDINSHSLIEAAIQRTGLTDFGSSSFMEPLEIMIRAVEEGDKLHPFGRFCFRQLMINLLVNRLFIENGALKMSAPEASSRSGPLIIMGLPRTGTSYLLNLMASDSRFRYLTSWEAMHPVIPPSTGKGKRKTRRLMAAIELATQNYLAPTLKTIHNYHLDGPEECTRLLFNHFTSQALDLVFDMPAYREWLESTNYMEAYSYHKKQLQLLGKSQQSQNWLLKSPYHLPALEAILKNYPHARIIHLYRDPLKSVPSFCSLTTSYRGICQRQLNGNRTGHEAVDFLQKAVMRFLEAREKVGESNILDINYSDLTREPLGVIQEIYRVFDLPLGDDTVAAIKCKTGRSPQRQGQKHCYSPEQFGLKESTIRRRFSPYMDKFNL